MTDQAEREILHRELDTDADNPGVEVAKTIADIEDRDATDLSHVYECVDGVLDNLFSTPPTPEAQMEVTFSYENYRVTVEQNGDARLVKTETG